KTRAVGKMPTGRSDDGKARPCRSRLSAQFAQFLSKSQSARCPVASRSRVLRGVAENKWSGRAISREQDLRRRVVRALLAENLRSLNAGRASERDRKRNRQRSS